MSQRVKWKVSTWNLEQIHTNKTFAPNTLRLKGKTVIVKYILIKTINTTNAKRDDRDGNIRRVPSVGLYVCTCAMCAHFDSIQSQADSHETFSLFCFSTHYLYAPKAHTVSVSLCPLRAHPLYHKQWLDSLQLSALSNLTSWQENSHPFRAWRLRRRSTSIWWCWTRSFS